MPSTLHFRDISNAARAVLRIITLTIAGFAAAAPAAGQCYYTYTPIPRPPGYVAHRAGSINDHGAVAGVLFGGGDTTRVYTWSPETGTVVLPLPPGIDSMENGQINNHGHIAGAMWGDPAGWFGYVWDGSSYTIIELPGWADSIYVSDLNDAGEVVGTVYNVNTGPLHAFVWQDGVFTDLADAIGRNSSGAAAINQESAIAGWAPQTLGDAFLLDQDSVTWLTEPPGQGTEANGMNNNDFIVGVNLPVRVGDPAYRKLGAIWTPDGLTIITPPDGTRDAVMTNVNDAGRAVGYYERGASPADTAFSWQDGVITELRSLIVPPITWRVLYSRDINSVGQITVLTDQGPAVLTPVWMPGDVTGDCHVNLDDLALVLSNFGSPLGSFPRGDVDVDGDVDLSDLAVLLTHWGQ